MAGHPPAGGPRPIPGIDTTVPHSARIWNYWLGGEDNYPVDRAVGEQIVQIMPSMPLIARVCRQFIARTVHHVAAEVGIRQFLDIGTGLPTADNTHEVAQRAAPECRIVYVDNDPLVLTHAQALLTSSPEGVTDYIEVDLEEPATILRGAGATLDFSQPVCLLLVGVLAHVPDYDEARSIVRHLVAALPTGSHLILQDGVAGFSDADDEGIRRYNESGAVPYILRSREEIAGFFDGLQMVEPGLVWCQDWRPAPEQATPLERVNGIGGIGRKP